MLIDPATGVVVLTAEELEQIKHERYKSGYDSGFEEGYESSLIDLSADMEGRTLAYEDSNAN